jgi:hypothetical protein
VAFSVDRVEISAIGEHVPRRVDFREFECAAGFTEQDVGCE